MKGTGLHVLIVDNSAQYREQLRAALLVLDTIEHVHLRSSLAQQDLDEDYSHSLDLIFVAGSFRESQILALFKELRKSKFHSRARVVVLADPGIDYDYVLRQYYFGIDGFLLRPYTAEGVAEVIQLSLELHHGNSDSRMKQGLALLIKELRYQLNKVASLRKSGRKGSISYLMFKEMGSVLKELDESEQELYFKILIEELNTSNDEVAPVFIPEKHQRGSIDKASNS